MYKIGILYCSYGIPEYFEKSITPWVKAKEKYDIKIAAVHGQFKEYHNMGIKDNDIDTVNKLTKLLNKIDYVWINNIYAGHHNPEYLSEAEIRNKGLEYLLSQNVDYVILWDGDEEITDKEIDNLIKFLSKEDNRFYSIFQIEYKNLVFNSNSFITGFNPKRIWRVDFGDWKLSKMIYDNDMEYSSKISDHTAPDSIFLTYQIPTKLVNPLHYSWNDYERSCQKINYQLLRWGNCSFSINKKQKCIEFSKDYYKDKLYPTVHNIEN